MIIPHLTEIFESERFRLEMVNELLKYTVPFTDKFTQRLSEEMSRVVESFLPQKQRYALEHISDSIVKSTHYHSESFVAKFAIDLEPMFKVAITAAIHRMIDKQSTVNVDNVVNGPKPADDISNEKSLVDVISCSPTTKNVTNDSSLVDVNHLKNDSVTSCSPTTDNTNGGEVSCSQTTNKSNDVDVEVKEILTKLMRFYN